MMRSLRTITGAAVAVLLSSSLSAAVNDRILSAVPADAVTVGLVHIDQLRSGSFASRLFNETNKATLDGDAEKFLREAGLDPSRDVDTVAFALSPAAKPDDARPLVVAEGRFAPERLGDAISKRGAKSESFAGKTLYLLPGEENQGAVAFVDKRLVVAGHVDAVRNALTALASGGTRFAQSGGLALDLARIPASASCWMLTDVQRAARMHATPKAPSSSPVGTDAFATTLKMLQTVALWSKDEGETLSFGGTAVTTDGDTRTNVADMLRGLTAAWRMAAQEKKPELVNVIRGFKISEGSDSVSIEGSIPTALLQEFAKPRRVAVK